MRTIPQSILNQFEGPTNSELLLIFAEISHPELSEIIRVVTEDVDGYSRSSNGEIINYNYGGKLYYGFPFIFSTLTDDDRPPRAQLQIQNVDRRIGRAITQMQTTAGFRFFIGALSDWALTLDSNNARTPTGTPSIFYDAKYLELRNIRGDDMMISADINTIDVANEPCTAIRTTQDRTPGLYR